MSVAPNFTEEQEAEAIERIERLIEKRTAQHRYVAQAQREVVGRQKNLLIIAEELNRAQAWLDRIQGRNPRKILTHTQFMAIVDDPWTAPSDPKEEQK